MRVFALFLFACAPSVPDELPPSSPASPAAQSAPVPNVGVALRSDPPLPGEDTSAWPGLGDAKGMMMHDMDGGMEGMHHHGH